MFEILGGQLFGEDKLRTYSQSEITARAIDQLVIANDALERFEPDEVLRRYDENTLLKYVYAGSLVQGNFHNLIVTQIDESEHGLYKDIFNEISLKLFSIPQFISLFDAAESPERLANFFLTTVKFALGLDNFDIDSDTRINIIISTVKLSRSHPNEILKMFEEFATGCMSSEGPTFEDIDI